MKIPRPTREGRLFHSLREKSANARKYRRRYTGDFFRIFASRINRSAAFKRLLMKNVSPSGI